MITRKIDVREYAKRVKLSIETAARNLRIESLLEIAKEQNCTHIATAHQKNDNAETIIQRLSRGTGFRGLCGIWPLKEFTGGIKFVRPLLCATREEIIQYLNGRNLKWCTDRTNKDFAYRRNFIRHRLLPALAADCRGDIVERLAVLAGACRGFYRLVSGRVDSIWPNVADADKQTVTLDMGGIAGQPAELVVELVRRALIHLGCGEQDVTERHYQNVLRLHNGAKLQLPQNIEVHRQGGTIGFTHPRVYECRAGFTCPELVEGTPPMQLKTPGKTVFAGVHIEAGIFDYNSADFENFKANKSNTVEWFDFEKLKLPLEVRLRKRGDKFWPLGLKAEKKVGKFLTNAKVSSTLRRKLLVVNDSEKIIWLCPVRISEQTKIRRQTKTVLQLKITDKYQA